VTLADEDTNSILTDNANRAKPRKFDKCNFVANQLMQPMQPMQSMQPMQPMQVVPFDHQI